MKNLFLKSFFNDTKGFITVETLASTLKISRRTIYRRIKKGEIKTIKSSGYHIIKISSLKNFIKED